MSLTLSKLVVELPEDQILLAYCSLVNAKLMIITSPLDRREYACGVYQGLFILLLGRSSPSCRKLR